jgi:hypothetical protein
VGWTRLRARSSRSPRRGRAKPSPRRARSTLGARTKWGPISVVPRPREPRRRRRRRRWPDQALPMSRPVAFSITDSFDVPGVHQSAVSISPCYTAGRAETGWWVSSLLVGRWVPGQGREPGSATTATSKTIGADRVGREGTTSWSRLRKCS